MVLAIVCCQRGYVQSRFRGDQLTGDQERFQVCSGRDELCRSVLNDEWASHPTWASEDSGFVAHRKNTFEEQLHRIEEERHDYDYNVQAAERTIQLLEPIAVQIEQMTVEEQARFQLDPRIGGTSTTIYQRLIKKVYGREAGQHVIEGMFSNPCMVIPFTLARIKERMAKWKASQVRPRSSD
jgi:paired amphipathic helix protein Sin3a